MTRQFVNDFLIKKWALSDAHSPTMVPITIQPLQLLGYKFKVDHIAEWNRRTAKQSRQGRCTCRLVNPHRVNSGKPTNVRETTATLLHSSLNTSTSRLSTARSSNCRTTTIKYRCSSCGRTRWGSSVHRE